MSAFVQCEAASTRWQVEQLVAAELAQKKLDALENERRHRKRTRTPLASAGAANAAAESSKPEVLTLSTEGEAAQNVVTGDGSLVSDYGLEAAERTASGGAALDNSQEAAIQVWRGPNHACVHVKGHSSVLLPASDPGRLY